MKFKDYGSVTETIPGVFVISINSKTLENYNRNIGDISNVKLNLENEQTIYLSFDNEQNAFVHYNVQNVKKDEVNNADITLH